MRIVPLVWRRMASACVSSPAFWAGAAGIPLLCALHWGGNPVMAAAGALAFSVSSSVSLCWAAGRARRAFVAALEPTCGGLAPLAAAELSLPVLLGAVLSLAVMALLSHSRGQTLPWQTWPVAVMSSALASSIAYLAVRRSVFLAVIALAAPLLLGFVQDPPGIVRLAAWPSHAFQAASRASSEGGGMHPDAFVALDTALGSAGCAFAIARMHGRRLRG
ncbi:hypothetical protein GX411_00590 [Candidatus Fermentibacteria bacterium]|nr:hypothetical protein [Candidatus Fermentibacteria bacterium]